MESRSIDQWRHYFRNARGDIFDVIKNAIAVAASDYPEQFQIKKIQLVEFLFVAHLTNAENNCNCNAESKEQVLSRAHSSVNENGDVNLNYLKDYNHHEAEALTMMNEEEKQLVEEVLRIKELLSKFEDQSEDVVMESLQRLQMMSLTVEILQKTMIGRTVNRLCTLKSKRISNFARLLVSEWKGIVEQWLRADADIQGEVGSPDSVHLPGVQKGFPSPPLDEGAFLATQTALTKSSKFSETMDDDGGTKNGGEFKLKRLDETKPAQQNERTPMRALSPLEANIGSMKNKGEAKRRNDSRNKQSKDSSTDVGLVKAPKSSFEVNDETMLDKKMNTVAAQPMSLPGQQNRVKLLNEEDPMKLEAARNKLHNGYQQAENAKKQRKIQVVELQELPKQGVGTGHPRAKSGKHNWKFSRGPR